MAEHVSRRVCCYARVRDTAFFSLHEVYKVDLDILSELGYQVTVVNTVRDLIRQKCDLYYAWWFGYGVLPALLGRIRGKPVIVSGVVHAHKWRVLSEWPPIKRWVIMVTLKLANCSIFASAEDFSRLEGFVPRKAEVVPLTVDLDRYVFEENQRQNIVLMITHLTKENVERKMVIEAIEAFARFAAKRPDFQLVICGAPGDGEESVLKAIQRFGQEGRVLLQGRVTFEQKIDFLQNALIYLQPTIQEAFGLAIGEALACGTPVVTSPEPCLLGVYQDAVLYGKSSEELAEALHNLVDNVALYSEMRRRGLSQVKQYSRPIRRERLRKIFDAVA